MLRPKQKRFIQSLEYCFIGVMRKEMVKPDLILHAGRPKTGTSTIQQFLKQNAQILAKDHNIYFPLCMGVNQRWLTFLTGLKDEKWAIKHRYINNTKARDELFSQKLNELLKDLKQYSTHQWIMSSEILTSGLAQEDDIKNLKRFLKEHFNQIQIVIYIREQTAAAISALSQRIKGGHVIDEDFLYSLNNPRQTSRIYNYELMLTPWIKHFGKKSIKLKIFCKTKFKNSNLTDDFCDLLAIKSTEAFELPEQVNTSLSESGMRLLNEFNRSVQKFSSTELNNDRQKFIFKIILEHSNGLKKYCPSIEMVQAYEECFKESNEWIRRTFFPQQHQLWKPYLLIQDKDYNETTFNINETERILINSYLDLYNTTISLKNKATKSGKTKKRRSKNKQIG